MKLIEDLGMIYASSQGRNIHYGLYECPMCHDHFTCRVSNVKSGATTKCMRCANALNAKIRLDKAAKEFLDKAMAIHGDTYDYSITKYTHSSRKVDIICRVHGAFAQEPRNHLSGQGCKYCAAEVKGAIKSTKAAEEFEEKASNIHHDKYDYSLATYINSRTKVKIICATHGVFEQIPDSHLQGQGCPNCAVSGFDKAKPAILYYIKVHHNNTIVYKIGITNRSIKTRFNNEDFNKIIILKTWKYLLGADAYAVEQQILKQYKDYRYIGDPILSSGNTELFTVDILQLDTRNV